MLDHAPRYRDVFKGLNRVCGLVFSSLPTWRSTWTRVENQN
jgi:hypothetical protein